MDPNGDAIFKDYDGNKTKFGGQNITYTNINNMAIDGNIIYVDAVNDSIGFFTTTPANESYIQLSDKFVICDTFTSAGINACIDALGSDGGEVYLPEGTYSITTQITIDYSNTTLTGAGAGTILQLDSNTIYCIYASDKSNITIRNIRFDGNESSIDTTKSLIYLNDNNTGKGQFLIENCYFVNCDYRMIEFNGSCTLCSNNVTDCYFYDSDDTDSVAIYTDQTYAMTRVEGCGFSNIDRGVHAGNNQCTVSNCNFISCADYGVIAYGQDCTITANTFDDCVTPVYIGSSDKYSTISDNIFYLCGNPVKIYSACSITGNIFHANVTGNDIYVDVSNSTIIGNKFIIRGITPKVAYNIYLDDDADNTLITGNQFSTDSAEGRDIYIASGSQYNNIYGNRMDEGFSNNEGILAHTTGFWFGETRFWQMMDDAIADDGTVNLPDATLGMVFACITDPNDSFADASGYWMVAHDGVTTLVSGTAGTTANTDSDGDLCVYDGGTYAILKNRMGNVGKIRAFYFYR